MDVLFFCYTSASPVRIIGIKCLSSLHVHYKKEVSDDFTALVILGAVQINRIRAMRRRKNEKKANAVIAVAMVNLNDSSPSYVLRRRFHRIFIEYGFPSKLCAFIRFSGPRHATVARIFLSLHTPNVL